MQSQHSATTPLPPPPTTALRSPLQQRPLSPYPSGKPENPHPAQNLCYRPVPTRPSPGADPPEHRRPTAGAWPVFSRALALPEAPAPAFSETNRFTFTGPGTRRQGKRPRTFSPPSSLPVFLIPRPGVNRQPRVASPLSCYPPARSREMTRPRSLTPPSTCWPPPSLPSPPTTNSALAGPPVHPCARPPEHPFPYTAPPAARPLPAPAPATCWPRAPPDLAFTGLSGSAPTGPPIYPRVNHHHTRPLSFLATRPARPAPAPAGRGDPAPRPDSTMQ